MPIESIGSQIVTLLSSLKDHEIVSGGCECVKYVDALISPYTSNSRTNPNKRKHHTKSNSKMLQKRKSIMKLRERVKAANNLLTNYPLQRKLQSMPKNAAQFIESQLRNVGRRNTGRRFTTLYKAGPKVYCYYSQVFALPSKSTINKLLQDLSLIVGINNVMLHYLRNVSQGLKEENKYVSLIFDEIFLMPGLKYDMKNRVIHGFEDLGAHVNKRFADHAFVFMIRGLQANWRLPFAFYFNEGGIKTVELVHLIKDVVNAVTACGLNILTIVCDQAANNVAAVNYLKKDIKAIYTGQNRAYDGSILIGNTKIFSIFNVPHLLKGVRNNLLNADLAFKVNGQVGVASWRHIEQMYEQDKGKDIRAVPKLTDFHIKRDKIRKMKVKYCSQVFSQRVASQVQVLVDYG